MRHFDKWQSSLRLHPTNSTSAGYGSIIAKSDDGLYLQASILIAPTLLSNGRIGLAYGSDVYPILGLFKNRVPTANNYTGYSIDFPVLLMQKVVQ